MNYPSVCTTLESSNIYKSTMDKIDIDALHESLWRNDPDVHGKFIDKLSEDHRVAGLEKTSKGYTEIICALANVHNIKTYPVQVIASACAKSAASFADGDNANLMGHCFDFLYQSVGCQQSAPIGVALKRTEQPDTVTEHQQHIDINIAEATAAVDHDSIAHNMPLGIERTNILTGAWMALSSDSLQIKDGQIEAMMNYTENKFVRNIFIAGQRMCIVKGNPGKFGIPLVKECCDDAEMGSVYSHNKATKKIKAHIPDFQKETYLRIRALANLETRKPAWSKETFRKNTFASWYSQPAKYFKRESPADPASTLVPCSSEEYHNLIKQHDNKDIQSIRFFRQSEERDQDSMNKYLDHVVNTQLNFCNYGESEAVRSFATHAEANNAVGADPATKGRTAETQKKVMKSLAASPKPLGLAIVPCMSFIIVHATIHNQNIQQIWDTHMDCARILNKGIHGHNEYNELCQDIDLGDEL